MRYVVILVVVVLAFIALLPLITQMGRKIKSYFVKEMQEEHEEYLVISDMERKSILSAWERRDTRLRDWYATVRIANDHYLPLDEVVRVLVEEGKIEDEAKVYSPTPEPTEEETVNVDPKVAMPIQKAWVKRDKSISDDEHILRLSNSFNVTENDVRFYVGRTD